MGKKTVLIVAQITPRRKVHKTTEIATDAVTQLLTQITYELLGER